MSQQYSELARLAAALSSPIRLRALNLLFQGEKSIEELATLLGESEANTAAHMKKLREVGLVSARRQGRHVFQRANADEGVRLFLALRDASEALLPAMQLLNQKGLDAYASQVGVDELEAQVRQRRAALLDLRPRGEFEAGHLPGARSLPFAELTDRAGELPRRLRLLVYCRGKHCPNAERGTVWLRGEGLRAERLRFGVPEWIASGRSLQKEMHA